MKLTSPYFDSLHFFIEPKMSSIKRNENLQEKSQDIYAVLTTWSLLLYT